jgi:hypothetical protein
MYLNAIFSFVNASRAAVVKGHAFLPKISTVSFIVSLRCVVVMGVPIVIDGQNYHKQSD